MKKRLLAIAVLLTLGLIPAGIAEACPRSSRSNSLVYSLRDNNRCEGIRARPATAQILKVVAFFSTSLNDYPETLTIRVPGVPSEPQLAIESSVHNYLLDGLQLSKSGADYRFTLNPQAVLRPANVPINSLRGVAFVVQGGSKIHYPLILNEASGEYRFVIYRSRRTPLPTVEILNSSNRVVWSDPIRTPNDGFITRRWSYDNVPAGRYILRVVDGTGVASTFTFEHNPAWLP